MPKKIGPVFKINTGCFFKMVRILPRLIIFLLFLAKVESVEENLKTASLNQTELREYCEKLFKFKKITVKKFNTWGDRRTYNKQAQQVEIEKVKKAAKDSKDRPAFPEGNFKKIFFFNFTRIFSKFL